MRIVITGASGFVGRSIVPLLQEAGAELLLVGRSPGELERCFPGIACCAYDQITQQARGYDLLLHLAVANNNTALSADAVRAINVDLTLHVLGLAREAGISRFVNVSSVHALNPRDRSPYAQTKREAAEYLRKERSVHAITVYLPLVHGERWSGKLRFLNRLPPFVAEALFRPLAALKPTVNVHRLAGFVLSLSRAPHENEIILSDDQLDNLWFRGCKRAMDLLFAASVMALFWWGLILIWVLVRLQSPGPAIFAQERIGRHGKVFTCYKFRTMKLGTLQAGTHEVSSDAITPVGNLLRSTKLDELPQIWNILRNEISLIGPRPCLPVQTRLIEARTARGVLQLKPGITGLAQINGVDMSDPEVLACWDARYRALQSLALDFGIAVATAKGRGGGDRIRPQELHGSATRSS